MPAIKIDPMSCGHIAPYRLSKVARRDVRERRGPSSSPSAFAPVAPLTGVPERLRPMGGAFVF